MNTSSPDSLFSLKFAPSAHRIGFLRTLRSKCAWLILVCILAACSGAQPSPAATKSALAQPAVVPTAAVPTAAPSPTPAPSPTLIPSPTMLPSPTSIPSPTPLALNPAGALVQVGDIAISLVDVYYSAKQLQLMLAVKNTGPTYARVGQFQIRGAEGRFALTALCEFDPAHVPYSTWTPGANYDLLPGDIARLILCFPDIKPGGQPGSQQLVYSTDNLYAPLALWDIAQNAAAEIPPGLLRREVQNIHALGETVSIKDLDVTYTGMQILPDPLQRTQVLLEFTLLNKGSADFVFEPSHFVILNFFKISTADGFVGFSGLTFDARDQAIRALEDIPPGETLTVTLIAFLPGGEVAPGAVAIFLPPEGYAEPVMWQAQP